MSVVKNTEEVDVRVPHKARRRAALVATSALAFAAALLAGTQLASATPAPPEVPTSLSIPAGNVLSGVGRAQGFQLYTCQAQGTGHGWTLLQPMAVLLAEGHKPFALHYGGPSWTAMDGSTVTATRVAGEPAPSGTSIPWLKLAATPTSGPDGGTFSSTTFIQRLNTTGGVAPTAGCDAAHVGATAPVFYTADYYFYRATRAIPKSVSSGSP